MILSSITLRNPEIASKLILNYHVDVLLFHYFQAYPNHFTINNYVSLRIYLIIGSIVFPSLKKYSQQEWRIEINTQYTRELFFTGWKTPTIQV